jgi:hypothetical protein
VVMVVMPLSVGDPSPGRYGTGERTNVISVGEAEAGKDACATSRPEVGGALGSENASETPPEYPQGAGRIHTAAEAATTSLRAKSFLGRTGERFEKR